MTGAPSHRYGYRGGGAARDRAAAGTAEAAAAGEAPGDRRARPRAHQAALTPEKPHPCHIAPVAVAGCGPIWRRDRSTGWLRRRWGGGPGGGGVSTRSGPGLRPRADAVPTGRFLAWVT